MKPGSADFSLEHPREAARLKAMSLNPPRTVIYDRISYSVVRLYSSGLGTQYACTYKTSEGEMKTLLLTEESVEKEPSLIPLYQACAKRFDDHLSFAKYLGSSSFWQSQLPPDGITKRGGDID
jgi:hypothetical protein